MTPQQPDSRFWTGISLAALTALLWGLLGFALQRSFVFSDPATVSWFRFFLSFLILGAWSFFRDPGTLAEVRRIPWWMIPASLGLALNYFGYATGVQMTTPGNAQMLSQLGPIFVVVGGILILKERLTLRQWTGVAIALSGFLAFYYDQVSHLIAAQDRFQTGNQWIFFGSVTWAAWALLQKRASQRGLSSRTLNLFVYGWCAVFLLPTADFRPFPTFGPTEWGLLVLLALNTLVAYGALAAALSLAPSSLVNLVISTNPLLALAVSYESVHLLGWIGALLVLTGVVLSLRPQVQSKG